MTFNIKRLKKEVSMLKKTKGRELFFRKKEIETQSKITRDKLLDLETKVSQAKNREAEGPSVFADNFNKKTLVTMADIQQEYDRLIKTKEELLIAYTEA